MVVLETEPHQLEEMEQLDKDTAGVLELTLLNTVQEAVEELEELVQTAQQPLEETAA